MNKHQTGLPDLFLQSVYVIIHPLLRHSKSFSNLRSIVSKNVNVQSIEVGDVGVITHSRAFNTPCNADLSSRNYQNLVGVAEKLH